MFIEAINKAVEKIERTNQPFEIKCLVSKQKENILWYLALYSDWLFTKYSSQHDRYEMILKELIPVLNHDILSQFGGVIIFDSNNPMKKYLMDNKVALQSHPIGTWIHTPNVDYPWVMRFSHALRKKPLPKSIILKRNAKALKK